MQHVLAQRDAARTRFTPVSHSRPAYRYNPSRYITRTFFRRTRVQECLLSGGDEHLALLFCLASAMMMARAGGRLRLCLVRVCPAATTRQQQQQQYSNKCRHASTPTSQLCGGGAVSMR